MLVRTVTPTPVQIKIDVDYTDLAQFGAIATASDLVVTAQTGAAGNALGTQGAPFGLPANFIMLACRIKHSVLFAGPGPLTALTLAIGDNSTKNLYETTFDIVGTAVSATGYQDGIITTAKGKYAAASALSLTFVATGCNFNAMTAGKVTVWLTLLPMMA